MAVEINNPTETIKEEVKTWVAMAPDAEKRLEYARQQVGLVGDRRVLEVLEESIHEKNHLSQNDVIEAAIILEGVIQMREHLYRRHASIGDIGNAFADVLVKRENFRNDAAVVKTYRRVASAVSQLPF